MTIWLIGGTSESKQMAQCLSNWGYDWLVTVATPLAAQLYSSLSGHVETLCLTPATVDRFLSKHAIHAIIDASHPFAIQISQLAIQVSQTHRIPYLRVERPSLPLAPSTFLLPDVASLLRSDYLDRQRVLLTTGVKTLSLFANWHQRSHLWARILPNDISKQQALAAGFPSHRLIEQRLPLVRERERQLWRSLDISTVVTKEAGAAGGFALKQELALELGVRLIAIARPPVHYPQVIESAEQAQVFCRQLEQP